MKGNRKIASKEPDMERNSKTTSPKPQKAAPVVAEPIHRSTDEEIQQRAFEKYCARQGKAGDALHDWLEAERELSVPRRGAETDPID